MNLREGTKSRADRYIAIMILSFPGMLLVSWKRWSSIIADSGREMDLPRRLFEGEILYRDVHYLYPPFAPYFNALLYRVFGMRLEVLNVAGIVCSAIIAFIAWRIARRVLDEAGAALATLAVIILCIFKPAGNMIAPYAFAALYGVLFSLGTLLFTLKYAEHSRRRDLLTAGVLIGLAAITKQEFALAGAATLCAALIFRIRPGLRRSLIEIASAAAVGLAIALPVYGWLFYKIGRRILVEDCHLFYTHLPASLVFYNTQRTGMNAPFFSLLQIMGAASVAVLVGSAIVLLSDRTRKTTKMALIVLASSLIAGAGVRLAAGRQWDGSPLRALPVLLIVFMILEWRRRGRENSRGGDHAAIFIIAVYSLAILARVALRVPSGGAFGGFFLPTSLILFCYLFLRALPESLEAWTQDEIARRRARAIAMIILTVTIASSAIVFGIRYRRNFSYPIIAQRGTLYAPAGSGPVIDRALDFLERNTSPGEAVAVLPEGSDLTFLTGRRMPLRHQILIPGLMSEADELEAIDRLLEAGVHYVLIVNRPMREFGAEAFGRDFYQNLGRRIDERYRLREVFGADGDTSAEIGDPRFFIRVRLRNHEERKTK